MAAAIVILYAWFGVYLLSIWLDGMVQQQYGVARNPFLIEKCINICRKTKKSTLLVEETDAAYSPKTANDAIDLELGTM